MVLNIILRSLDLPHFNHSKYPLYLRNNIIKFLCGWITIIQEKASHNRNIYNLYIADSHTHCHIIIVQYNHRSIRYLCLPFSCSMFIKVFVHMSCYAVLASEIIGFSVLIRHIHRHPNQNHNEMNINNIIQFKHMYSKSNPPLCNLFPTNPNTKY